MKVFTPLFQAVIAFVAILTGLGFVFNLLLAPVKKDIANLETRMTNLEDGQAKLETGQVKLEKRMDNIEVKLDTLLALIKKQ